MRRDVFQAIADPTRREIIYLLSDKSFTLNGVANKFKISRPAISKHVKILTECGLVNIEMRGRERFCRLNPHPLKEVSTWLEYFNQFWDNKLNALKNHLEENNG